MAKTKGPLLSLEAHGAIAKELTFHRRWTKNYGRAYHKPGPPPSHKQRTQRRITEFVLAQWLGMNQADRNTWKEKAEKIRPLISGYHYFLKCAQADLYGVAKICGYWSFNEPSGDQVLDYSGNGNHGTLKPSYPTDCPTRVSGLKAKMDLALNFDGQNDYVDCGSDESLDIADYLSLEVWIKKEPLPAGGYRPFARNGQTSSFHPCPYQLRVKENGVISFTIGNNVTYKQAETTVGLRNAWHHLVGVMDATTLYLYFDGKEVKTAARIINPFITTQKAYIARSGVRHYKGVIDEVRVCNRVMTPTEIAFLWQKGRP